jgi:hypothetical protein
VKRIRGQHGRVAVARSQPTELGRDLVGADPGRLEQRCALYQLGGRRSGRRGRRAALVVEGDAIDLAVADQQ